MKKFIRLVTLVLVVLSLAAAAGQVAGAPGKAAPASVALSADEQQALDLLNADRKAAGLPALRVDPQLMALARDYAQDMVVRGFIGHDNPEGESPFDRMRRYGVSYHIAGENLAANRTVAEAHELLMASKDHRENILRPEFSEVGIGIYPGPRGTLYLVQEFVGR